MATQQLPTGSEKEQAVKELVEALIEDLDNEQFLPDGKCPMSNDLALKDANAKRRSRISSRKTEDIHSRPQECQCSLH
jgi:hypothetical protein